MKTLVVGYGAIGREIALKCRGLGMDVSAVRNSDIDNTDGSVKIHPASALDALLGKAEVLFLTLPLTDRTKEMFDARRLARLSDGTVLINVSRGRIIDEKALYETLKSGRIRAGLDVWYNYPDRDGPRHNTPPSQYPFHDLPNVIMTPHLAGHCENIEILRAIDLAALINQAATGKEIPNRVNPERGY